MRKIYNFRIVIDPGGGGDDDNPYAEPFWIENKGSYSAYVYSIQSGYSSETVSLQYSFDRVTWIDIKASYMLDSFVILNVGEKVYFRGNVKSFNSSGYTYEWNGFTSNRSTNILHIGGNIMSLFYKDNFVDAKSFDSSYKGHCMGMFTGFSGLVDASKLLLPATDIYTVDTYSYMFSECSQLVYPPIMDMKYIGNGNICRYMFYNCTKLIETPDLKPINMNYNYGAYAAMFQNCSSLTKITLRMVVWGSYNGNYDMFTGIAENGTIYLASNATWSPTSYGVPSSWTISKTL